MRLIIIFETSSSPEREVPWHHLSSTTPRNLGTLAPHENYSSPSLCLSRLTPVADCLCCWANPAGWQSPGLIRRDCSFWRDAAVSRLPGWRELIELRRHSAHPSSRAICNKIKTSVSSHWSTGDWLIPCIWGWLCCVFTGINLNSRIVFVNIYIVMSHHWNRRSWNIPSFYLTI